MGRKGVWAVVLSETRRAAGRREVYAIPGGAEHSGKAITVCRILDVFQRVREEYVWED